MTLSGRDPIPAMRAAAEAATEVLVRRFHRRDLLQIETKGPSDFVSAADREAEDAIRRVLARWAPEIAFLGEESGGADLAAPAAPAAPRRWLVDPLDGTTNFLNGLPFAVSIALEDEGVVVAGLIHDPLASRTYTATRGSGSLLNGQPLRVRDGRGLLYGVVGTSVPLRAHRESDKFSRRLRAVRERCAGIRVPGSAALALADVAAGRLAGHFEGPLDIYDHAAGCLVVQEAGGIVTDYDGGAAFLETGFVVAAAPIAHGDLLSAIICASGPTETEGYPPFRKRGPLNR